MGSARLERALAVIYAAQREHTFEARELDCAIDELVGWTADSYSRHGELYTNVRGIESGPLEESLTQTLLATVRDQITSAHAPEPQRHRWRLLDVGAGSGRDLLRLASEPDVAVTALDNAPELVKHLRMLAVARELPAASVIEAEMRDLSCLSAGDFHCVRNHASLHHLPVVGPGHGADLAIAESRRVLVRGGVFYVFVRAGDGLALIDTQEGLGPRVFQLFSQNSLRALLERHNLRTLTLEHVESKRGNSTLRWLFGLAEAI